MSLTKQEKNKYPETYGYGSKEDLLKDPNNKLENYVSIVDGDNHIRYIPCTEEYFHMHRNENRNEQRREQRWRSQTPVSLDALRENYEFEFSDPSYERGIEQEKEQNERDAIWELVSEFSEKDQLILKLYNNGHTDIQIGEILSLARSTIQEKRIKLINELKEKYKKLQK